MIANKEIRGFVGSAVVFMSIMGLLGVLFFVEVPEKNNDIVKVIIGMLVSSLAMILYTIAGKDTNEVEHLKLENEKLKETNKQLSDRIVHLEHMFMTLQEKVINKLSIVVDEKKTN